MTREAVHPKAVHDLKQLISKAVEWEDKWAKMAAEHKETLPVIWKMAALMELCLPDVQDVVYQNVGVSGDYDKLKQSRGSWRGPRTRSRTPWDQFPWTSAGSTIKKMSELSPRIRSVMGVAVAGS